MEKRKSKVLISSAGGTAAKGSKTYKISVPSSWFTQMGLDESNRDIELSFDGRNISIAAAMTAEAFATQKINLGHDVRKISFYDGNTLCTAIYADFTDKTLKAQNYTDNLVKTAFGNNALPVWEDFMEFLKERCIPSQRSGIREYLEALGLDEFDPIEIIKKTSGRMAEDEQWLEMEVLR